MNSELNVDQSTLVNAWQERLPTILKPGIVQKWPQTKEIRTPSAFTLAQQVVRSIRLIFNAPMWIPGSEGRSDRCRA